jgi:hypothetical protein
MSFSTLFFQDMSKTESPETTLCGKIEMCSPRAKNGERSRGGQRDGHGPFAASFCFGPPQQERRRRHTTARYLHYYTETKKPTNQNNIPRLANPTCFTPE